MLNFVVMVDGVVQNNCIFYYVLVNVFDLGLMKFVCVDVGVVVVDVGLNVMVGVVVMEMVDVVDILQDGCDIGGNVWLFYVDNGQMFGCLLMLVGWYGGFEWLGYLKVVIGEDYEIGVGVMVEGSVVDMQM